jgi:hypothetical protein
MTTEKSGEITFRFINARDLYEQIQDMSAILRNDFRDAETPRPVRVDGGVGGGVGGGPKVHPAETRERINAAAAAGKEALAKQRAEQAEAKAKAAATETPAPASETAKRKRGRPAKGVDPGEDLSGDREEGDTMLSPDEEPADPLAPDAQPAPPAETAVRDRTPREKKDAVVEVLRGVWGKNRQGVLDLCKHFDVKVIPSVPDDRVEELWTMSEALCRKFGVPFVDENVVHAEEGMV